MTKYLTLLLFTLVSINVFSQTISQKPIYEGSQRVSITEFNTGAIGFSYQNPDYKTIIDIVGFYVNSKTKAIELIDKAIFILNMEKTDKDQNINDNIGNIGLIRYGFAQKTIYIQNKDRKAIQLEMKELLKIKLALENYSYQQEINK